MFLKNLFVIVIIGIITSSFAYSQKTGFVSSNLIREYFPEAKAAEQRIQSMVDEWKRELATMQTGIENLEFEIQKNRLIWSDAERVKNEEKLKEMKAAREAYAKDKFEPDGLYEDAVARIMRPVEEKIYAAIQKVANDQSYDFVFDQSVQPLTYVNYKYDLSVKVLKQLGVPAEDLEAELEKKIKEDPRNQEERVRKPRRGSSRNSRRRVDRSRKFDRNEQQEEEEQNNEFDEKIEVDPEER